MKKLMTLIIIAGIVVAWAAAFAADPDGGAITATVRTNTTAMIQITTAPDAVDSVFVCHIAEGSTDTTFDALIDTVTTSKLITGLRPASVNYWFLLTRQGAGGPTALSDIDTLTQYGPEIELIPTTLALTATEKMVRAVSWRPDTIYETFTVNGTSGVDSTGHYRAWKNNSLTVKATQAGDSVKVMAYIAYGHREMTQTGATFGFAAYEDSLNISSVGTFRKTLTANLAAGTMYIKFQGYTGNGKNAAIEVQLIRDRY